MARLAAKKAPHLLRKQMGHSSCAMDGLSTESRRTGSKPRTDIIAHRARNVKPRRANFPPCPGQCRGTRRRAALTRTGQWEDRRAAHTLRVEMQLTIFGLSTKPEKCAAATAAPRGRRRRGRRKADISGGGSQPPCASKPRAPREPPAGAAGAGGRPGRSPRHAASRKRAAPASPRRRGRAAKSPGGAERQEARPKAAHAPPGLEPPRRARPQPGEGTPRSRGAGRAGGAPAGLRAAQGAKPETEQGQPKGRPQRSEGGDRADGASERRPEPAA